MEIQTQNRVTVKYQGAQHLLPDSFIQSLPDIVKREITEPTAKKAGSEGRQNIVSRVISILDVKFENQQAADLAITEYKSFIRDYNLTSAEIFAAYKMALKEQLFDENGKLIEVYPNLSLITAGKVLNSYLKFKSEDKAYEQGKEQIKAYLNPPPPEPTEEEKREQRRKLHENVADCFLKHGECEYAFLIYEDLKDEGVLEPYRETEKVAAIQSRVMGSFLQKELTRNLFYNKQELAELSQRFKSGQKYKIPGLVIQEVKNEIIKKYYEAKNTAKSDG